MGRFPEVEAIIAELIGLDPESIGERAFDRAVEKHLARHPDVTYSAFLGWLRTGGPRLDDLIDRLMVPETWFFRDQQAFELLRQSLSEGWINRLGGKQLRLLSAPCSTGEEAYSIAISLWEAGLTSLRFRLDAWDVSNHALSVAREARYGPRSFRRRLPERYRRFFLKEDGLERVAPEAASAVNFSRRNLLQPGAYPEGLPYHVIFCKNLTIYLTAKARAALVNNVKRLLHPEGLLFVGHSEAPLFMKSGFEAVQFARSFALCIKGAAPPLGREQQSRRRAKPAQRRVRPTAPASMKTALGLRAAEESISEPTETPVDAARRLADRGELSEAARVCAGLIKSNSLDPNVYYLAGLIEQASNRLDSAEDLLSKAVYLDPMHYESLVQLTLLSEQKGQGRKAAQYRDRLRRLQPKSSEAE